MEKKIYYYKRDNGVAVFADGTEIDTIKDGRKFIDKLIKHRRQKELPWRLYLDLAMDYEQITEHFFTPEYWANTTWEVEADK